MIDVLIVGAGNIAGWNEDDSFREKPCSHLGAYRSSGVHLVKGICDVSLERARGFANRFSINKYFDDIAKALEQLRPDLVSIAVPYQAHRGVVQAIVTHRYKPKAIFCEKPIAGSLEDAKDIIMICRENDVRLFVNNRRLTETHERFSSEYKAGIIGEGIAVQAWCSSGLHAIGIHMIEFLRQAFGEIQSVFAVSETKRVDSLAYSTNYTADDPRINAQLKLESGMVVNFMNTALTSYSYFEIEVLGSKGKMRVLDNAAKIEIRKAAVPGPSTLSFRLSTPEILVVENRSTLFQKLALALVDIDDDSMKHPLSGIHGLRSYQVLEALVNSAQVGQPVRIDRRI